MRFFSRFKVNLVLSLLVVGGVILAFSVSGRLEVRATSGSVTHSSALSSGSVSRRGLGASGTDWPQFGFDNGRAHFNPNETVLTKATVTGLKSAWSASTVANISAEPVVVNEIIGGRNTEVVYVTTQTNTLYALNAVTGSPIWSYQAPSPFSFGNSSVAVATETIGGTSKSVVYAAAGNSTGRTPSGELDAFDATNGTKLWTATLDGATTSPLVVSTVVYVGTTNRNLYAFDATMGGTPLWTAGIGGVTTSPSLSPTGGSIYVGMYKPSPTKVKLATVNVTNGKYASSKPLNGVITAAVVANNVLYVSTLAASGSTSPNLYAFQTSNGQLIWSYTDPAGYGYNGLAVANGILYAGGGSIAAPWSGELSAFTLASCTSSCAPTTVVTNSHGQNNNLTVAGGVLYTTFLDQTLKAFDASTLQPLWTAPSVTNGYGTGVVVTNGMLYVGTNNSQMVAFQVPLANISLSISAGPPTSSVSVSGTGFGSNEQVNISFNNGAASTTATTDSTGAFTTPTPLTIPPTTLPGSYTVQSVGQTSGTFAQATFVVRTDWPQFGFGPTHSHVNPYENVLNTTSAAGLTTDWTVTAGGYVTTSPAIANGVAYFGSLDHNVYAVDATTGAPIWVHSTGGAVYSSPAVATVMVSGVPTPIVYVGTEAQKLIAINALTNNNLWIASLGHLNDDAPTVATVTIGGTPTQVVYIGSSNAFLYAINAATGKTIWKAGIGNDTHSAPAVANGMVYIGSDSQKLYAFDAATGALKWTYHTSSAITSSPAVATSTIGGVPTSVVYFGSDNSNLYAVDATTGKFIWYYTTSGQIHSSPAIATELIGGVSTQVLYVGSYDSTLYAFDITNGKPHSPLWTFSTNGIVSSSPAVANGVVYVGSYDDKLYAFDATNGDELWSSGVTIGGAIAASPVVANGIVYVGAYDNNLYAFNFPGGGSKRK